MHWSLCPRTVCIEVYDQVSYFQRDILKFQFSSHYKTVIWIDRIIFTWFFFIISLFLNISEGSVQATHPFFLIKALVKKYSMTLKSYNKNTGNIYFECSSIPILRRHFSNRFQLQLTNFTKQNKNFTSPNRNSKFVRVLNDIGEQSS